MAQLEKDFREFEKKENPQIENRIIYNLGYLAKLSPDQAAKYSIRYGEITRQRDFIDCDAGSIRSLDRLLERFDRVDSPEIEAEIIRLLPRIAEINIGKAAEFTQAYNRIIKKWDKPQNTYGRNGDKNGRK